MGSANDSIKIEPTERYDVVLSGAKDAQVEAADAEDFGKIVKAWLAFDADKLVGGVGLFYYADCYSADYLFVSERYRGRGIAIDLVNTLIEYAKNRGITNLYLFTKIPTFFSKHFGFKIMRAKNTHGEFLQFVYRYCSQCEEFGKGCRPAAMHLAL